MLYTELFMYYETNMLQSMDHYLKMQSGEKHHIWNKVAYSIKCCLIKC